MLITHPNIETPSSETVIWRYLDLERFLAMLCTRELYLCRIDKFKDKWEGTWPRSIFTNPGINWAGSSAEQFAHLSDSVKNASFVSCWHGNSDESAAFWDLYANRSGIAIQSTVAKLQEAIQDKNGYYIGKVQYLDFETSPPPIINMLVAPFLKRKSFEHEKEIRILYWEFPPAKPDFSDSQSLAIDMSTLVENIYVSPSSPEWLRSSIEELCHRFGISCPVIRSSLYDPRVS